MTGVLRSSTLSFIVGLMAGVLYWLMEVPAPAPPWIALVSLLGINLGEHAGDQLRKSRGRVLPVTEPGTTTDES
jgi:XapX domain-containing protein